MPATSLSSTPLRTVTPYPYDDELRRPGYQRDPRLGERHGTVQRLMLTMARRGNCAWRLTNPSTSSMTRR